MVDLGQAGDVPGVGGLAGAALAGVTGEAFEGGGAEEVDLGPGAALDAVDGAGPGVGAVGAAVGAVAGDELPGEPDVDAVLVDGGDVVGGHGGDGHDAAVVEPLTAGAQGAVYEEAVTGGVAPFAVAPGGSDQFRAV